MKIPLIPSLFVPRAITGNVTNTSIVLPYDQPQYAIKINPQLAALSIEMDRWTDWSGDAIGKPNVFVNTVLKQVTDRTGAPMFLRVGANSEDRGTLNPSIPLVNLTFPPPTPQVPAPEANAISIGRDFYAVSNNLPEGTDFHWGVNMVNLNSTETLAQVSQLASAFQNSKVNLRYLELGNEADFYSRKGAAYAGFTPLNYTLTWVNLVKKILEQKSISLGDSTQIYMTPGAFARVPQLGTRETWPAISVLGAGLLDDQKVRDVTKLWNSHLYSGAFSPNSIYPQGTLMNKANVRGNLSERVDDLQASQRSGLDFALSETNSYANHGVPGLSNTAESTIWGVDYMLKAATLGISRVHFHNGRGFPYSVIQPAILAAVNLDDGVGHLDRPHIGPLFYSFLIVGEAIGTSGKAYVAELGTLDAGLSAYAIYEDYKLRRIVVLNSKVYLPTTQGGRTGSKINLTNWTQNSKASVKRFAAAYTNSTLGLTWAGQDFDTASGTPSGTVSEEMVTDGVISIEASSAIIICFK